MERGEAAGAPSPHRGGRGCQAKRFELFPKGGGSWKLEEDVQTEE